MASGVPDSVISKFVGHKDERTTRRHYDHADMSRMEQGVVDGMRKALEEGGNHQDGANGRTVRALLGASESGA
jgi:hypothetical protein